MLSVIRNLFTTLLLLQPVTRSTRLDDDQKPFKADLSASHNETESLLALHKDLVSIDSTSGKEHDVGQFLIRYLEARGFSIKTQEIPTLEQNPHNSSRLNVYAYNGKSPESTVLVTSHIDTVPPYYNYSIKPGNEIWGRGAVDAKGSVAAQVTATLSLLESEQIKKGDVALLFVVGEEVTGDGMKRAVDLNLYWDTAIFGEPTELKLVDGHKGVQSFRMVANGKAAHSGYPWLGESAVSKLVRALAILDQLDLGHSDKYGNTTVNIGRVDGGVAVNVVPAHAEAYVLCRLAVGPIEEVRKKIKETIGDEVAISWDSGYDPVDCDTDVEGFETMTVNYGTDVPHLKERVGKRYLYGPGNIFVAHSDHEHLNVKDLQEATQGYKKLILHGLKGKK